MKHLALVVCLVAGLAACGGQGGGSINPSPKTITSVAVSPATTTVATGKTATFTATTTGTGNYSSAVTWSASAGTITSSGVFTAPNTPGTTVTVTATSTEDPAKSGSASAKITAQPPPLAVSVSASATTVNTGGAVQLTAAVTGGDGSATVSWSATAGTVSPATGLSTTYTAPSTVPNPSTVTITATATDSTGSATATASVTVQRVITISVAPNAPIPNNELYSDFGALIGEEFTCIGCEVGDTSNVQSTYGGDNTTTFGPQFLNPWETIFNFAGTAYAPGPISMWVVGSDGTKSNTLYLTFDGSQNVAVQDPSSGEIYYYYSGNGTQGSFSVLKFKQNGTADGNLGFSGNGIAVDNKTHDVLLSQISGVGDSDPNGQLLDGLVAMGNSTTNSLAVDANDGLACATQLTADTTYCFYPTTTAASEIVQAFSLPGLPTGSQPIAVKVIDASHVAVYCRGNQTLYWFTISGTTATAAGTLALLEFTTTDANYWKTYPATGGWDLVEVGSSLCVMGQMVNTDGTVSQKLALVNSTNQTLTQYVDLPNGTVHITPDPTNNAIVAEYPDFTVSPPVTRFERIYVDTGNSILLTSTSNLVPGAGFLITNDGSHIAIFVEGKTDFQPNQ